MTASKPSSGRPDPARPGETWGEYTRRMTDAYAPYFFRGMPLFEEDEEEQEDEEQSDDE